MRFSPRRALMGLVMTSVSAISFAAGIPDLNSYYHFRLTKGRGMPVCNAYVERLNAVDYYNEGHETALDAPYCGRPENDAVPGFAALHRVPLTIDQINALELSVFNFTHPLHPAPSYGPYPLIRFRQLPPGGLPIWRYDPRVDIENDGEPDDVMVWQGIGAGTFEGACGGDYRGAILHQSQVAYVMKNGGTAIDETKTQAIFGSPSGGYLVPTGKDSETKFVKGFKPIGTSMSIYEFRGLYYFDALFGDMGAWPGSHISQEALDYTFGLFLRQGGKTQEVCEVQMRNGDKSPVIE